MASSKYYVSTLSSAFDKMTSIMDDFVVGTSSSSGWYPTNTGVTSGGTTVPYQYTYSTNTIPVDDLIRKLTGSGIEADSFEEAKKAYMNMPNFPAANVSMDRKTGEMLFEIALPGYDLDDIDIEFENDYMYINISKDNALNRARKGKKEDAERILFHQGLKSGAVELKVPVPATKFKVQDAVAEYENGILLISVPRLEEAAPIRVKVKPKK